MNDKYAVLTNPLNRFNNRAKVYHLNHMGYTLCGRWVFTSEGKAEVPKGLRLCKNCKRRQAEKKRRERE